MLAKVEMRFKNPESNNEESLELLLSDYKDFDGVKLATTQVEMRGGKKFAELTGISYKFLRSIDDTVFNRP